MPREVSNYIVDSYVRLRKLSKDTAEQKKLHTYTSARTLLGVLRLSQALARLRFADIVQHDDVDEALRLMECSKESLNEDEDRDYEPDRSVISQIYRLIKQMAAEGGRKRRKRQRRFGRGPGGERDMDIDSDEDEDNEELPMIDVRSRVLSAGYTEAQLNDTIVEVRSILQSGSSSPLTLLIVRKHGYLGASCEWSEVTLYRYLGRCLCCILVMSLVLAIC